MRTKIDDYYYLLGVAHNATPKELRQAYLQLLVTAHPDKGGDTERFAAIQRAYGILSNPDDRIIYDEQQERKKSSTSSSGISTSKTFDSAAVNIQRRDGVTAIVHGQTQGTPHPQKISVYKSAPGQPIDSSGSSELRDISDTIQALLQEYYRGGNSESLGKLAEAHLQRAEVHGAAGRAHHAMFDIEEATRFYPECQGRAHELRERLNLQKNARVKE